MKYSKEKIKECVDWVRENGLMDYGGAKLSEFCRAMGIDNKTYYGWMKYSDFSDAIKKAKDEFRNNLQRDIEVSLAKAAKGYTWEQTFIEYVDDGAGHRKIKKQTKKTMYETPNVGAAVFLLTNLDPDKWKNTQRLEHTGSDGDPLFVPKITDKMIDEYLKSRKK